MFSVFPSAESREVTVFLLWMFAGLSQCLFTACFGSNFHNCVISKERLADNFFSFAPQSVCLQLCEIAHFCEDEQLLSLQKVVNISSRAGICWMLRKEEKTVLEIDCAQTVSRLCPPGCGIWS